MRRSRFESPSSHEAPWVSLGQSLSLSQTYHTALLGGYVGFPLMYTPLRFLEKGCEKAYTANTTFRRIIFIATKHVWLNSTVCIVSKANQSHLPELRRIFMPTSHSDLMHKSSFTNTSKIDKCSSRYRLTCTLPKRHTIGGGGGEREGQFHILGMWHYWWPFAMATHITDCLIFRFRREDSYSLADLHTLSSPLPTSLHCKEPNGSAI